MMKRFKAWWKKLSRKYKFLFTIFVLDLLLLPAALLVNKNAQIMELVTTPPTPPESPSPYPSGSPAPSASPSPSSSPLPNAKPVVWTSQLPLGIKGLEYMAAVIAYDNDTNDPLAMTISGLPAGLANTPCSTFTTASKKQKGLICKISGTPTEKASVKVKLTLTDGKETVIKTLPLTVVEVMQ